MRRGAAILRGTDASLDGGGTWSPAGSFLSLAGRATDLLLDGVIQYDNIPDVAEIAWGAWQREHISERHGVSARDFDVAWHDPERRDLATAQYPRRGAYYVSIGLSAGGEPLKMVWRWHDRGEVVWPITAYFPTRRRSRRRR